MDSLLAARAQMEVSLAFHMIFAALGIGMPLLMVMAEGLYLYGWDRLSPRAHWLTGIPVAVSGLLSGILVVAANAWMQTPSGFRLEDGALVDVDPFAVFTTPVWFQMALHSSLSCYIATGFAVARVYAMGMLRGRRDAYHRSALRFALGVATVTALLQPLTLADAAALGPADEE